MKSYKNYFYSIIFIFLFFPSLTFSQDSGLFTIVLGEQGGYDQSNLSCYLIGKEGVDKMICCDAGTISVGIEKALQKGNLEFLPLNLASDTTIVGQVILNHISAYLISHPHIDHISGMLVTAPVDNKKNIFLTGRTKNILLKNVFNWEVVANFTDEGKDPIGRYVFKEMKFDKFYTDDRTGFQIRAFPLSHSNDYESSAFLITDGLYYVLYIGDTGADRIENSDNLSKIWNVVAPLVKDASLRGIFIESSFSQGRRDNQLYGHLRPDLIVEELSKLSKLAFGEKKIKEPLKGLKVVITHIKPQLIGVPLSKLRHQIYSELQQKGSYLGCNFIIPVQGEFIQF
ncbi:MAG: MBL fold metallo-hydrolase [Bacteroidales bacterium]